MALVRIYSNTEQTTPTEGWALPLSKSGEADKKILLENITGGYYIDKLEVSDWDMSVASLKNATIASPSSVEKILGVKIYDDTGTEFDANWLYDAYLHEQINNRAGLSQTITTTIGNSYVDVVGVPTIISSGEVNADGTLSQKYQGASFTPQPYQGLTGQYLISFTSVTFNASNAFVVIYSVDGYEGMEARIDTDSFYFRMANSKKFRFWLYSCPTTLQSTNHTHTSSGTNNIVVGGGLAYKVATVGWSFNSSNGALSLVHNARADYNAVNFGVPGTVLQAFKTASATAGVRAVVYFLRKYTAA